MNLVQTLIRHRLALEQLNRKIYFKVRNDVLREVRSDVLREVKKIGPYRINYLSPKHPLNTGFELRSDSGLVIKGISIGSRFVNYPIVFLVDGRI